jgi:hypothetical protein
MQKICMTEMDKTNQQTGGLLVLLTSVHEDGGKSLTSQVRHPGNPEAVTGR